MRLDRLLHAVDVLDLRGHPATEVGAIAYQSHAVTPGALFCCVRGGVSDGHDFAADAVDAGAVALLTERMLPSSEAGDTTQLVVADTRVAMAHIAAAFHGHPSRHLAVAGVTGTNGKTSTVHLLAAALSAAGQPATAMGTLSGPRTTPEAPDLQAALAKAVKRGDKAVALEVSSHALALHRVDATWFEVAVFTNLSAEHLDFHSDMDDYFAAKASLFTPERAATAVVNADDHWGRRLMEAARIPTTPFSLNDAHDLDITPRGSSFRWRGYVFELAFGGLFGVSNALAAATAAVEMGADPAAVAEGISGAGTVPGRFETVDEGQPFSVVVDYAHTPGGLEASLQAARSVAQTGRVIAVFGCGGDRDSSKRPAMGEVASRLADLVVLTTDNPRSEDAKSIAAAVRSGFLGDGSHHAELDEEADRRAAIALALAAARPGDVVVVAGKGHETEQIVGSESYPFDDRVVVAEELRRLGAVESER